MPDKVLSSFLVAEALFLATGGLILGIVLVTKEHGRHSRTTADVASNVLLMQTPLSGIWIRGKRVENAQSDPLFSSRCYIQRWSDFLRLLRLIAGSCTPTSIKPHLAEAPRGTSRCIRNCDPRARLTSMAPNSANSFESWPPLGSAVESESKYSTAEGTHLSYCSFFKWLWPRFWGLISCSSDAVAISTTSPSRKTALAQVLLQRAGCRVV